MADDDAKDSRPRPEPSLADRFAKMVAPPELYDRARRVNWGLELEKEPNSRGPYVVELNLQHLEGLNGAAKQFADLFRELLKDAPPPVRIARTYYRCEMAASEWQQLLATDAQRAEDAAKRPSAEGEVSGTRPLQYRSIYKLWPDFPVKSQIYRSMPTIKADAALRSYDAAGSGIVWAVIDSGIHGKHPHFGSATLEAPEVRHLHRCFVAVPMTDGSRQAPKDPDEELIDADERRRRIDAHREAALRDEYGHCSHVAGIIAGAAPPSSAGAVLFERVYQQNGANGSGDSGYAAVPFEDTPRLRGVAPRCKLISLRVLDDRGGSRSSDIIRALAYIRETLNDNPKLLRVHGVNLSVGYEFDAEMFACGQSPVCAEVNRLVQSGVVVVTAAGNTGYGTVGARERPTKVGLSNTINDPGNADFAITVGATHGDSPHTFGVSYFSSKGPTGDGRLKPDLVAPGERIASCAAGRRLEEALDLSGRKLDDTASYYIDDSGTSMAAPHVSGAIAAFLSIRREFLGRPHDVKRIFTQTATPLGRERYFEGHGLVDLIRAIQSV